MKVVQASIGEENYLKLKSFWRKAKSFACFFLPFCPVSIFLRSSVFLLYRLKYVSRENNPVMCTPEE